MPESKESWLALFVAIIIPVAVIGPIVGYTVNGVTVHSPLFIFQLMSLSIESVPLVFSLVIDFIALMTAIIVFQIVAPLGTAGAIALAILAATTGIGFIWSAMS